MTDTNDIDQVSPIINLVNNAMIANTNSPEVLSPSQLANSRRAGLGPKLLDAGKNTIRKAGFEVLELTSS